MRKIIALVLLLLAGAPALGATPAQSIQFQNISANTPAFTLYGGKYALVVTATFGGGSVQLQTLAADGSTWINVGSSVTAAGLSNYDLPPGQYRLSVATATAVYAALTSVPAEA